MSKQSSKYKLFQEIFDEEKLSEDFGFYWENIDQILEQIRNECNEVKDAFAKGDALHCKEEIGDILHAAISLSYFCGHDPEEALEMSFAKYQKRLRIVMNLAKQNGFTDFKNLSVQEMLKYWEQAKQIIKECDG